MSHSHYRYVLAGGGVAAESAAAAIRRLDPTSPILMVGREPNRPYDRRLLSKRLVTRDQPPVAVFLRPDSWFADHGVELRTGRRVAHLEPGRQSVVLDSGQDVGYDALLLAVGAVPSRLDVPGANLPNLFYLRTLADADRLGHAVDVARAAGRNRVVVVGSGLLGTESAQMLQSAGFAVTLVVGRSHPWRRLVGPATGQLVAQLLQNEGIEVLNHRRVTALTGDGRVQHVVLDDVTVRDCDFAVACVGSMVDRELLRGTPLRAETAILTDETCRTVDPHVWAAGDCSAVFDPVFGKHRIVDHWDHAAATGATAGANMAGGHQTYQPADTFHTLIGGTTFRFVGEPRLAVRRVMRETTELAIDAGNRVVFAVTVDDAKADKSACAAVRERVVVE